MNQDLQNLWDDWILNGLGSEFSEFMNYVINCVNYIST
jgi:hypothetical protein